MTPSCTIDRGEVTTRMAKTLEAVTTMTEKDVILAKTEQRYSRNVQAVVNES